MKDKPLILVTNDDGINAPGIRALIDVMIKIGDVVVVAPESSIWNGARNHNKFYITKSFN